MRIHTGIHTLPISKRVLGYPYNIPNTINIPQVNRHKMKCDHESFTRPRDRQNHDQKTGNKTTKVEEQDIGHAAKWERWCTVQRRSAVQARMKDEDWWMKA